MNPETETMPVLPTVLVVDDDAATRLLVAQALQPDGFHIEAAASAAEGLDAFLRVRPKLVLLDVNMPGTSGFECCEHLRRLPQGERVPIIVLTAQGDEASIQRAFESGATDFLPKPVNWQLLAHRVRYLLRNGETVEALARNQVFLANHDALTALPNRNLLEDRMAQAVAQVRRSGQHLAVLVLDLDRFKRVNDNFGHPLGDALLKAVATRLKPAVREGDTLARLGGDEFIIMLPGMVNLKDAHHLAEKVLAAFSDPFLVTGQELHVTTSIGASTYPDDGTTSAELLKAADAALYTAKDKGRNNFQFYTREMGAKVEIRADLESALHRAVERQEFELHYQAKVDLRSGKIRGVEALIRWHRPDVGLVAPDSFVALAEETGLIIPISEWVLRTACAQVKAWHTAGYRDLSMAVNLSARQFRQAGVDELVRGVLAQTGLDAEFLELELTESALMQDRDTVVQTLQRLKKIGVVLSLDDFGTGYSSLSYLKRFPVDVVKIDQSFIRDVTHNVDGAALTKSIIAMARSLNMTTVAEGVETQGQLSFLRANRCDAIQGYYFSRPLPVDEMTALLASDKQLPVDRSPGASTKHTLLLVDDEPPILSALERLLRRDNYTILSTTSPREALELLAIHPVGVIVSDGRMPEMPGIELLRTVKGLYPDVVRIMLSGYTELQSVTDAINEGAVYKFLSKPWEDSVLRKQLAQAFRHYESNVERANTQLPDQDQAGEETGCSTTPLALDASPAAGALALPAAPVHPTRAKLLVVDDEPVNNKLLYAIFGADHEVFTATSGERALAFCADHLPDLILLDVLMPDMDGYEVCRRLKADPRTSEVPIIIVTARAEPEIETQGLLLGAVDFIVKPVNAAVVRARVRAHLQLRSMLSQIKSLNESLEERVTLRTKELESALRCLQESQESLASSEAKATLSTLAASVSHELGTPIGNSVMASSTLGDEAKRFQNLTASGTLRRSELTAFLTSLSHGTALIQDNLTRANDLLRNFQQVAADQASEQRRTFDLASVVAEIIHTLSPSLRRHPHRIAMEIAPGIVMDSQPGPLGQIVINLINNAYLHAFEHRTDGGVLTIRAEVAGDQVHLSFSDNGGGIPANDLERLFQPFFSTKIGQGGTGLGMAIVQNLVSKTLGGSMRVQSALGQGTCFDIQLPLVLPAAPL